MVESQSFKIGLYNCLTLWFWSLPRRWLRKDERFWETAILSDQTAFTKVCEFGEGEKRGVRNIF